MKLTLYFFFQANVINHNNDGGVFKISGSQCESKPLASSLPTSIGSTSNSESNDESLETLQINDPRISELRLSESLRSSPSFSSDGSQETELASSFVSDCFLDANADDFLEDDLIPPNGDKQVHYFNVSVHDMDSGLIYNLENVKCIQIRQDRHRKSRDDQCQLILQTSENLKFNSSKRLHGMKAEMAMNKHWGTTKIHDQNFIVYKGEMAFTFQFPQCYPKSSVNDTQWCL